MGTSPSPSTHKRHRRRRRRRGTSRPRPSATLAARGPRRVQVQERESPLLRQWAELEAERRGPAGEERRARPVRRDVAASFARGAAALVVLAELELHVVDVEFQRTAERAVRVS